MGASTRGRWAPNAPRVWAESLRSRDRDCPPASASLETTRPGSSFECVSVCLCAFCGWLVIDSAHHDGAGSPRPGSRRELPPGPARRCTSRHCGHVDRFGSVCRVWSTPALHLPPTSRGSTVHVRQDPESGPPEERTRPGLGTAHTARSIRRRRPLRSVEEQRERPFTFERPRWLR